MIRVQVGSNDEITLTAGELQVAGFDAVDLSELLWCPQTPYPDPYGLLPPGRPPWKIAFSPGSLYWPQGASRFAVGQYVATLEQVNLLRTQVGETVTDNPVTLKLAGAGTGDDELTFHMYFLHALPLQVHWGAEGNRQIYDALYLLVLVDGRYFFQTRPPTWTITDETTWEDLDADIEDYLGTATIDGNPMLEPFQPGLLLQAPTQYSEMAGASAGALIDAYCLASGRFFVANRDGSYKIQELFYVQNDFTSRPDVTDGMRHGGNLAYRLTDAEIAASSPPPSPGYDWKYAILVPEDITVVFPARAGDAETTPYTVTTNIDTAPFPSGGFPAFATQREGELVIYTTGWNDGTNDTACDNYALALARHWWYTLMGPDLACFSGILAIEPWALVDVTWITRSGDAATYVQRGLLNPRPGLVHIYTGVDAPVPEPPGSTITVTGNPAGTYPPVAATNTGITTINFDINYASVDENTTGEVDVLWLEASSTSGGVLTTGSQDIVGAKTFQSGINVGGGIDNVNEINLVSSSDPGSASRLRLLDANGTLQIDSTADGYSNHGRISVSSSGVGMSLIGAGGGFLYLIETGALGDPLGSVLYVQSVSSTYPPYLALIESDGTRHNGQAGVNVLGDSFYGGLADAYPGTAGSRGDVIFRGASGWERLSAGTSGYFLQTQGGGADPVWADATGGGGGGTVDSVVGTTDEIDVDATDPANPVLSLASAVTASLALADSAVQPGDLGALASLDDVTTAEIDAATLVIESEGIAANDNDTTLPTSAAVKDYVDTAISAIGSAVIPGTMNARLVLGSNDTYEVVDVAASSSVLLRPTGRGGIATYDGSGWANHALGSSISLTLSGLTSGGIYDVFVYWNSGGGTLALELSAAWASATTRTDALALQDGVLVKDGTPTRLYLGTFKATSTTQTASTAKKRFLWNFYNQIRLPLFNCPGYNNNNTSDSYTFNSTSWTEANGGTDARVEWVQGLAGFDYDVTTVAAIQPAASTFAAAGVGLDTTSTSKVAAYSIQGAYSTCSAHYNGGSGSTLTQGAHYLAQLVRGASGTHTVFIDDLRQGGSADPYLSYLSGSVWG